MHRIQSIKFTKVFILKLIFYSLINRDRSNLFLSKINIKQLSRTRLSLRIFILSYNEPLCLEMLMRRKYLAASNQENLDGRRYSCIFLSDFDMHFMANDRNNLRFVFIRLEKISCSLYF
jgi:hypothetical protein